MVISWVGDGAEDGEVEDGWVHGLEEVLSATYRLGRDLAGYLAEELAGGSLGGLGAIGG